MVQETGGRGMDVPVCGVSAQQEGGAHRLQQKAIRRSDQP